MMPAHRLGVLAAAFVLALASTSCRRSEGPEAEIRAAIDEMAAAAEAGDIGNFLDHVADEYSDSDGNDRDGLRGLLFVWLQRTAEIRVTKRVDSIVLQGEDEADVVVIAGIADGPITSGSTRSEILRFELVFERSGREWVVRRAAWSPAGISDLLGT